jgi:hypothetical protein
LEINVSGKMQKKFKKMMKELEQLEEKDFGTWKLSMLNDVVPEFRDEMISNLLDPFSRFIQSNYFRELCIWIYSDGINDYRDRLALPKIQQMVLNRLLIWEKSVKVPHPLEIVKTALESVCEEIEKENFWNKNGTLNFQKVYHENSNRWRYITEFVAQLQVIDLKKLSEKERKVFFINVYNLIMINGAIVNDGISNSILKREIFSRETMYDIGGECYSLDAILNLILRV